MEERRSMEENAEELSQANDLIPAALEKSKEPKNFILKWKTISSMIELLPDCLSELSTHPSLPKLPVYRHLLNSVSQTLTQIIHLAENVDLGKLHTQSQLHSLSTLLDMNIKDCKLLARTAVLGDFSAWEILVRLQIGQTEAKINALEALLEAAMVNENRISSVLCRSHARSLVDLLNSSVPKVKEKATMVICLLAGSRSCAEMLLTEGVILPLIRLSRNNKKAVVSLYRLSLLPEAARSIVSLGGGAVLMEICREEEEVVSLVAAAGALKNLSAITELQSQLRREGILTVILCLLESSRPSECRDYAAECLKNLTAGELGSTAGAAAALPKLLSFIDETAAPPAVAAVGNLVAILSPVELISTELLPKLARILRRGSPAAQQLAAAALQKACSKSRVVKRLAGESGCISLLVNLMSSENEEDLKTWSTSAMASLLLHLPNARTAKKDPRVVPTLVSLLSTTAKEQAVSCLLALSASRNSTKLMISHGAIEKLSAMAAAPNSQKLLSRLRQVVNARRIKT